MHISAEALESRKVRQSQTETVIDSWRAPIQTAGQPAFTGGVPTLPAIAAWTGQQVEAKAEILWYAIMCM